MTHLQRVDDLAADKCLLSMLTESADGVTPERDAKLEELKTIIQNKVLQPQRADPARQLLAHARPEQTHQSQKPGGSRMDKAVAAIVVQFAKKNAANLLAGRGGKLLGATQALKSQADFELITWPVIK